LSLVNSSTACVRKAALVEVGGFPVGVCRGEDTIAWVKLALRHPVAHAEVLTAIYNQQASNRSINLREAEPPGSLQYLAELFGKSGLTAQQTRGIALLFERISIFTAAGFRANGDLEGLQAIKLLAVGNRKYSTALAITALAWIPARLLRAAKQFRHHRTDA
jgi:hypothetical protein